VQRKPDYADILHCIQDVSTRWNSSYYVWNRLFFLKDAITQLQADLSTSTDCEIKKDGNRLHWSKSRLSGTYRVCNMCPICTRKEGDIQRIHTYRVSDTCGVYA
jgi:hypothetical protein